MCYVSNDKFHVLPSQYRHSFLRNNLSLNITYHWMCTLITPTDVTNIIHIRILVGLCSSMISLPHSIVYCGRITYMFVLFVLVIALSVFFSDLLLLVPILELSELLF